MRVPKEDGDSIGVEDYFGAKAADGALEKLLERHSGLSHVLLFLNI